MEIADLKTKDGYKFENYIIKEFKTYTDHDEWGVAFVWLNDIGVEYNFCIDNGYNSCAIYKTKLNTQGYMETDYSTFSHYEVNFNNDNWMEKLENKMCEALMEFFEL